LLLLLLLLSISPSLRASTFRATTNNAQTWIPPKHFANNPRKTMPNLSVNQQKEELQLHKNCSQRMLEKLQHLTVPHKLYQSLSQAQRVDATCALKTGTRRSRR
jgi:hypothetical protein